MKQKKENLQRLRMQSDQVSSTNYKPRINSKSKEIANRKKNDNDESYVDPCERLYKEGIVKLF